jgi:hypothetical protein
MINKIKYNSLNKFLILILSLAFFAVSFICCNLSSTEILYRKDMNSLEDLKILWLIRNDGTAVIFDENGGSYVNKKDYNYYYIVGTNRAGKTIEIKTEDVYQIQVEKDKISDYKALIIITTFIMTICVIVI